MTKLRQAKDKAEEELKACVGLETWRKSENLLKISENHGTSQRFSAKIEDFRPFSSVFGAKEDFREKEEARFQKETGSKSGANPADALKVSTQSEIDSVHQEK